MLYKKAIEAVGGTQMTIRSECRKRDRSPKKIVLAFLLFVLIYTLITTILQFCFKRITASAHKESGSISVFNETQTIDFQKIVILDAGHGGEDGGASSKSGVQEKDLNLSVALLLADHLRLNGIKVILTRDSDRLLYDPNTNYEGRKKVLDLKTRVEIAERVASEHPNSEILFLSIHMNAYPSESVKGLQVWYSKNSESKSKHLAESIQNTAKSLLQPENNRKVKVAGSNIYLLDRIEIPAVLVECGFLSNASEARLLSDSSYQKKLAFSLFSAVTDYFSQPTSP